MPFRRFSSLRFALAPCASALIVLAVAGPGCGSDSDAADGSDGGRGGDSGSAFADGSPGGDGGGVKGPSCATAETLAARQPVYLGIILDGSRSMDGHGSTAAGCDTQYSHGSESTCFVLNAREPDPLDPDRGLKVCHDEADAVSQCPNYKGLTGKKWIAIRGALLAYFDAVKQGADPRLGLGMYLFGSEVEKPADQWDVMPAFVDDSQLLKLRTRILPNVYPTTSGTPLRGSIAGQAPLLKGFAPALPLEPGGKRVLVVMTDGAATDGKQGAIDDVTALVAGSPAITTFVIGVGEPTATDDSVYDETFLSRLAFAGGAAAPGCNPDWNGQSPTGTPCHFQVTPGQKTAAQIQAEMTAAITDIATRVQSCELALSKSAPIDPSKVNVVYVDGTGKESQVSKDAANGWTYDSETDPTKVILNGAACTSLKADPNAKVTVVVGCPTGTQVR